MTQLVTAIEKVGILGLACYIRLNLDFLVFALVIDDKLVCFLAVL